MKNETEHKKAITDAYTESLAEMADYFGSEISEMVQLQYTRHEKGLQFIANLRVASDNFLAHYKEDDKAAFKEAFKIATARAIQETTNRILKSITKSTGTAVNIGGVPVRVIVAPVEDNVILLSNKTLTDLEHKQIMHEGKDDKKK